MSFFFWFFSATTTTTTTTTTPTSSAALFTSAKNIFAQDPLSKNKQLNVDMGEIEAALMVGSSQQVIDAINTFESDYQQQGGDNASLISTLEALKLSVHNVVSTYHTILDEERQLAHRLGTKTPHIILLVVFLLCLIFCFLGISFYVFPTYDDKGTNYKLPLDIIIMGSYLTLVLLLAIIYNIYQITRIQ